MSLSVRVAATLGDFHLDVDFQAPPGILALYGPSGSGKTVTLRCVSGLTRPRAGRIELNGRVLFDSDAGVDLPTRTRRIGYVFQQYALLPHLDVGANVGFGLHAEPRAKRQRRVRALLELVGLSGFEKRKVTQLSGGQQQRVALARAIAPQPELLLLDEPFAALDLRVRRRLRQELREVHAATRVPMVLVTHELAEVRQLADFLVLYDGGRIIEVGPTAELLRHPGSSAAAEVLYGGDDADDRRGEESHAR